MNVTTCIGCGQTDDHPKHVVVVDAAHNSVAWHMDCHAASSVACEVCASQIANAAGATGDALRTNLIGA